MAIIASTQNLLGKGGGGGEHYIGLWIGADAGKGGYISVEGICLKTLNGSR